MNYAGIDDCIAGIGRNLYYNGYDSDPELMGAAVKKVAKKIISKVKKLKKGGVSVTTGKGTMQYSQPEKEQYPIVQSTGFSDKLKNPKVLIGIGAGVIALYLISKGKRKKH